jgi:putative flippase GtrA
LRTARYPPPVEVTARRSRAHAALRHRQNWVQLGKFCAVGAAGYVVNLLVYTLLLHEGLHYLLAATCSFLVAVTTNYALNRAWTFRDRRAGVAAQGLRFLVVSLGSLGANLLVLHLLITLGAGKLVGQAIAIVLVTPLNFVGNRLWSFRHRNA